VESGANSPRRPSRDKDLQDTPLSLGYSVYFLLSTLLAVWAFLPDAAVPYYDPKRLKSGPKAQNHGTTLKHVPCSKTLQFAAHLRFRAAARFWRKTPMAVT
jgi:hypothetical protein